MHSTKSSFIKRPVVFIGFVVATLIQFVYGQETVTDTTMVSKPQKSGDIDTTITYEARDFVNLINERKTYLTGSAVVKYKGMTLKAGQIALDWDNNLLIAEGQPDTVWVPTADKTDSTLTIKAKDAPVLVDAGSQMTGAKMYFNYKTQKGRVVRGRTEFEGGKYLGRQIKKVSKETFNVSYSDFSTCSLDTNPHFHFEARRLKMITNDKVIAKPVVMYIGHIPVAALPFAVFPHRTGRHSGILIPRYGESTREGRYLREMGYYWAPNDYFDNRFTVDFFEKTGWLFRDDINYAVRYKFSGSVSGSLTRKNFSSGYKSRRWDLNVRHSQQIDSASHFSVNGYFVSDKGFYRDLSTNLSTRLTRELRSNATYSKTWPEQKLSLSMNVSHVRDLEDNTTQMTFPQMSLRKSQTQIFKPEKDKNARRSGRERRQREESKWYHSLYFSYGSNLYNSRREYLIKTLQDTTKKVETTRRLSHDFDLSLSSPKKYFGWLALNQSLSANEDWFDETTAFHVNTATNAIESEKVKGFAARHTFSYSASANTKLYGLFTPKIGDLQAIRHVATPSLSFRYEPDFSDPSWGYYTEVKNPAGQTVRRDRFGSTPTGGSKMVNFNVRNLFQMKRGIGEKEKKIDLFTMDFSTAFNFKAKQYRLSDLRTTWQANPVNNFSLSAGTTHSFYAFDFVKESRVNRYLFDHGGWRDGDFLRLTSLNLNASIRLQGKGEQKPEKPGAETGMPEEEEGMMATPAEGTEMDVLEETVSRRGDRFEGDRAFQKLSIPWRVNLTFNFNLDKIRPDSPIKRYYLDISGAEVSLTNNWRIGYSAHYDLEKGIVSYHRLTFYRDLHCWEAQIDWVPSGISKRFYFRINIKAPSLRDIKLERRGGAASVLGY